MKSTPEQTEKRLKLKKLVTYLGELAWRTNPNVAPHAVFRTTRHINDTIQTGAPTAEVFYVVEHPTKAIQAKATDGVIRLRFSRYVIEKPTRRLGLWHVWEPGYAATKPECVDELLPVLIAKAAELKRALPTTESGK